MLKDSHSIFRKAQHLLEGRGATSAGGSVSCIGLDLLVKTGANIIGFIGQDFAFPKGQPYNRTTLSHYFPDSNFADVLGGNFGEFLPLLFERLKIKVADGRDGVTHANLISYLRNFEQIVEANPQITFCNINPEGASIRGCRNIFSLPEFESLFGAANRGFPKIVAPPEVEETGLAGKIRKLLLEEQ